MYKEKISASNERAIQEKGNINQAAEKIENKLSKIERTAKGQPKSLLGKIRGFLKRNPSVLAVITALELMSAAASFAKEHKAPIKQREQKEMQYLPELPKQIRNLEFRQGDNYIEISDDELALILEHNIKIPESFAEAGKMFIEPVSFIVSTSYEKNNPYARVIFGKEGDDDFVVNVDVPYQYASDFKKAAPAHQKKMEQEMAENAKELFEKIMPSIAGPSFFKNKFLAEHGSLKNNQLRISNVHIAGYASPEATEEVNIGDSRNNELSRLRAENAAMVLRNIFQSNGVGVKEIGYLGEGEMPFSEMEENELLKEAYQLKIGTDGVPENRTILDLIKLYNNGGIKEQEALAKLETIVGGKRKVAVEMNLGERRGIIAVPLPLLLLLLIYLISRENDPEERKRRRDRIKELRSKRILDEMKLHERLSKERLSLGGNVGLRDDPAIHAPAGNDMPDLNVDLMPDYPANDSSNAATAKLQRTNAENDKIQPKLSSYEQVASAEELETSEVYQPERIIDEAAEKEKVGAGDGVLNYEQKVKTVYSELGRENESNPDIWGNYLYKGDWLNIYNNDKIIKDIFTDQIARMQSNTNKNVNIADFGGAEGTVLKKITEQMRGAGFKVFPVDVDLNLKNLKKRDVELTGIRADLLKMPIKDEKIDYGILRFVLPYNRRELQMEILQNILKALRRNGKVIILQDGAYGRKEGESYNEFYAQASAVQGGRTVDEIKRTRYFASGEELKEMAEEAGFTVLDLRELSEADGYLSPQAYASRFKMTERQLSALQAVFDEYENERKSRLHFQDHRLKRPLLYGILEKP